MLRCIKTKFKTSQESFNKLFLMNVESARVWNDCIRFDNEHITNTSKCINKSKLQKMLKGKYDLHSKSIKAVCHKYLFARDSAFKATKKGYYREVPYKNKKYFNTKWTQGSFKITDNNVISLSLNLKEKKRQQPIILELNKAIPGGVNVKEIELIYDRELQVAISYDNYREPAVNENKEIVAVDLGEIHSIAAISTTKNALVISGRKMRSIHRFRNKKIAELQSLMSKCEKNSNQWKKYNNAKQYILNKSNEQLKYLLHKITKEFTNWCKENNTKKIIVGDVEGIQRNTKNKMCENINQKLSNWCFGKLQRYLNYKAEALGIDVIKIDESYTTQTCPACNARNKPSSRNYRCNKCGYNEHRDLHGAKNIMSKYLYKEDIRLLPFEIENIMYLRIA